MMLAPSEVLAGIKNANDMVASLCEGKRKWIMSIPARVDHDPDLVIGNALRQAELTIETLARNIPDAEGSTPLEKEVIAYLKALDEWMDLVERKPESIPEQVAWRIAQRHEKKLRTLVLTRVEAEKIHVD